MAEVVSCDVDVVGGTAPGCCDDSCSGGGVYNYCAAREVSNMPTPSAPYCVSQMPPCTSHPCVLPLCFGEGF